MTTKRRPCIWGEGEGGLKGGRRIPSPTVLCPCQLIVIAGHEVSLGMALTVHRSPLLVLEKPRILMMGSVLQNEVVASNAITSNYKVRHRWKLI